jgi:hypothetical protein
VVSRGAVLAAALLVGCGERASESATREPSAATASVELPSAPADTSCPPTGRWEECSLVRRLEQAGLAPRRRELPVRRPPLTPDGVGFDVGRGELEAYIYPSLELRQREQALLDSAAFVGASQPVSLRNEPTLIVSGNLLAVLRSASDRQRERVSDALTAGAPQPQ